MVKWNGKLEYTYTSQRVEGQDRENNNNLKFRLEPSAEVNSHWHVNARLDADTNMKTDAGTDGKVTLKRAWAQGDYDSFMVKLGKMELLSSEAYAAPGAIVFDQEFSGAEVSFGKDLQVTLQAGRVNLEDTYKSKVLDVHTALVADGNSYDRSKTANYQHIGLQYNKNGFLAGADYYRLGSAAFSDGFTKNDKEKVGIWGLNLGYRFDKNSFLSGAYAHNSSLDDSSKWKKSYQVSFDYKGAQSEDKGSWGAYVAYRYLGGASVSATQDGALFGSKGIELGTNYTAWKNVILSAKYFNGKMIEKDAAGKDKVSQLFGRVEFLF